MQAKPIRTNRRQFLITANALAAGIAFAPRMLGETIDAKSRIARLANDPLRPQYHLLPPGNWMNDPNGPIWWKGKYHLFYQLNPRAATWGDMHWGHAVSTDMMHWKHEPIALAPTPDGPDSFGCFSGSAIAVGKRVYAVYTGTKESTPDLATIRDGQDKIQESQCLAYSDDPRLVTWTKVPKPIVPRPPEGMQITGFRDPSAWKQGNWYYMTVGSGISKIGGCVLLYRSKDLQNWEYLHELSSGEWSGTKTANPCDDGEMWECPEFFALDGGHVLIYSTLGKVFWQSGELDAATMKFTAKETGLLDLDAFYAPKTQLDAHGRRILWGWIPERRSEAAMREAGWSGMMSLPRVMKLDADGTLCIQILPETSVLRRDPLPSQETHTGVLKTLTQATGEVLCTGRRDSPLQFIISNGATELINAVYSPQTHSFTIDGKEIVLQSTDEPSLHAFVDGSVIELIVSERMGCTKRFYYAGQTAPDISVHATGTGAKMVAWKIAPISPNRLTTPANNT